MKPLLFLIFTLLFFPLAQAETGWSSLSKVVNKYRASGYVKTQVEKKQVRTLLNKTNIENGTFYFGKGLLRFEIQSPQVMLLVYDGTYLWSVIAAPKEFKGEDQISQIKIDEQNKEQIFFSQIMIKGSLYKHYTMASYKSAKGEARFEMKPKDKNAQITELTLVSDEKAESFTKMIYKDNLDNETTLSFSKIEFVANEDQKLFSYQPPKGAKVNKL